MELVSVVVPVYKVEKYLDKCIQSIQKQTYGELEIILVDDGSPDSCGAICDEYAKKDGRIQVVHKPNGGLSDARNAGVQYATGKYLLFVDSDDYICETLVEKTVKAAEENQCDMVLFDYYYVENNEKEVRTSEITPGKVISLEKEKTLLMAPPSAWSKLFNRQFYIESDIRFPVGVYYEDLGTTPKFLLKAKRIFYVKEPMYYYMIRSDSIMGSRNYKKNYEDKAAILNQVLDYYRQAEAYEKYRDELEYLVFANVYFEPLKEIVLARVKTPYLDMHRRYMREHFPDFMRNQYIKKLGKKDLLHLHILNTRQYWMMRVLSECRKAAERIRERIK